MALTCTYCKHASEYLLPYWFPYFDPTCAKGHDINPNKPICEDFEFYKSRKWGE